MEKIVTIIPINLATNSYKFTFALFLSFHTNQKQEPNFQQVGGLARRNNFAFCLQRIALYFKAMPNSIDFYKRIFLHVIPSWYYSSMVCCNYVHFPLE